MHRLSFKSLLIILVLLLIPLVFLFKILKTQNVQAGWFDDSWGYRKSIDIGNTGIGQTNVYITLTIGTSDTSRFQTDCGDIRFTTPTSTLLPYHIVSGCGSASTIIHVNFSSLPTGNSTFFLYYGNPNAVNGFSASDFSTAATSTSIGSPATEELSPAPIAYWKFDEGVGTSAFDSSSKKNNGVISSAVWTTEDQCVSGKCLSFNGTSGGVNFTSEFIGSGAKTACAWIKPTGWGEGGYGVIFNNDKFKVYLYNTNQNVSFVSDGGSGFSSPNNSISLNSWQYLCVARASNGTGNIYLNGKSIASGNSGTPAAGTTNLYVGNKSDDTRTFQGYIDEVKLYNYVRSADEIKVDYNQGAVTLSNINQNFLSDGLVGYWKMDESTGTSVVDSSGNNNTGTLTNAQETGTAQTGGSNTTILDGANALLSSTDDAYNGMIISITGGSCGITSGTERIISDYTGASKTITVSTAFSNTTDTCTYQIKHQVGGKFGNGVKFDGSNSENINLGGASTLNMPNNKITLSVWYKSTFTGECCSSMVGKFSGENSYLLYYNGGARFVISTDGTANGLPNGPTYVLQGTRTINDGVWHHITSSYDGNKMKLYYDGKLNAERTLSITIYQGNSSVNIAPNPWGIGAPQTNIDEVRIYNRALSPAEVTDLYNWAPGPFAYWNFEEGIGSTAKDIAGGYDGTWEGTGIHYVPGKFGKAAIFNGNNDRIKTNPSNPIPVPKFAFTAVYWMKPENFVDSTIEPGWFALRFNGSSTLFGITGISGVGVNTYAAVDWNLNEWQHVAVSWDGTTAKVIKNGNKTIYSGTGTGLVGFDTCADVQTVWFAVRNTCGAAVPYNQKIAFDDVKFYNYARTQQQILEDMNGGGGSVSSGNADSIGSPIAYYNFNEGYGTTVHNLGIGGTLLNGTLGAGTSAPSWTNIGKFGKALLFDGTNDYVGVGSTVSNTQSVSFWVNPTTTSQYIMDLDNGTHYLRVNSGTVTAIGFTSPAIYINGIRSTTLAASTWQHVIVTTDTAFNATSIKFGKVTTNFLNGSLDDVKIYNYALTQDEVKTDYNQGSSLQMGQSSQTIGATTTSLDYCIPGDTSPCSPPVGEWKFEEKNGTTINNTSVNNNNGSLGSGDSAPTWTTGKIGSSLKFDGINDYVDLGYTTSWVPKNIFTVSAWIKTSSSNPQTIIMYGDEGGNQRIWQIKVNNTGNIYIESGYANPCPCYTSITSTITVNDNKWHYISMTKSGFGETDSFKLFIDGIFQSETTTKEGAINNGKQLTVGVSNELGSLVGKYFNGSIDQIRIYNYARTPAQIAYDYNQGAPIAQWKFDECQGNTANDSSGIGNSGTIIIGASGTQTSVGTCTTSSTAWGNGATGKLNSSLNFDGVDDYVPLTSTYGFQTQSGGSWTLAAWANTSVLDSNYHTIIAYGDSSNNTTPHISLTNTNKWRVSVWGNDLDSISTPQLNTWTHIVGTFDGTTMRLFVNGKVDVTPKAATSNPVTTSAYIGAAPFSGTSMYWNGKLDDIRLYNYALTDTQVKTLFNGGAVNYQ